MPILLMHAIARCPSISGSMVSLILHLAEQAPLGLLRGHRCLSHLQDCFPRCQGTISQATLCITYKSIVVSLHRQHSLLTLKVRKSRLCYVMGCFCKSTVL